MGANGLDASLEGLVKKHLERRLKRIQFSTVRRVVEEFHPVEVKAFGKYSRYALMPAAWRVEFNSDHVVIGGKTTLRVLMELRDAGLIGLDDPLVAYFVRSELVEEIVYDAQMKKKVATESRAREEDE